ncbi:hypothetical protein MILUP08_42672 [Micromonospora lupini str. Lupac 08]|uniref:Uncharacterized protein n=1 Tax=Micromonospora lupini str. Lupac 08 TaxID=1150864 RepID=I0L1P4_9ACTN|nr:hypothetical protein MILUP08_42672 [Micromonospora lupini str. Lupac 08]
MVRRIRLRRESLGARTRRAALRPRKMGPPRCRPGRPPLPLYASRYDPLTGTEGYREGQAEPAL